MIALPRRAPVYLCCLIFVFFFVFTAGIQAGADEIYVVKKGDNLLKISKKFSLSVKEIQQANNLSSIVLQPGNKLKIPDSGLKQAKRNPAKASNASAKAKESGLSKAAAKETTSTNSKVKYHTVRKGETLASISREYSLSVRDLAEMNSIKKSAKLKPGRKLIVGKEGPETYTVKKGDTLWRISNRFDISAEDLMEINGLESAEVKIGQKLLLEVRKGDTDTVDSAVTTGADISREFKAINMSPDLDALTVRERLILFARKMLDIPYRFGGSTFMGIDCSGYVQKVFGLLDVPLPRTAREQFHLGEPVNKEDLSIGDLVFFKTYASFPSHVGIYLGNDLFIHASSKSRKVSIDSLDTPYYFKRFIGAKRLFNDELRENPDPADRS
ncbi:MAG TPA: LysM peptidoglycan-binding domain-containing protein [Thermodesulfovibrionales bacterium]|nr:LysM peptidoglycan-binding domain-containing protein [Thermodesulfovibrionales bacterium]